MIIDTLITLGTTLIGGIVEALPAASTIEWPVQPAQFAAWAGAFLALDRYLPIHEQVAVVGAALAIRGALLAMWVSSFVYNKLPGKAT